MCLSGKNMVSQCIEMFSERFVEGMCKEEMVVKVEKCAGRCYCC